VDSDVEKNNTKYPQDSGDRTHISVPPVTTVV